MEQPPEIPVCKSQKQKYKLLVFVKIQICWVVRSSGVFAAGHLYGVKTKDDEGKANFQN